MSYFFNPYGHNGYQQPQYSSPFSSSNYYRAQPSPPRHQPQQYYQNPTFASYDDSDSYSEDDQQYQYVQHDGRVVARPVQKQTRYSQQQRELLLQQERERNERQRQEQRQREEAEKQRKERELSLARAQALLEQKQQKQREYEEYKRNLQHSSNRNHRQLAEDNSKMSSLFGVPPDKRPSKTYQRSQSRSHLHPNSQGYHQNVQNEPDVSTKTKAFVQSQKSASTNTSNNIQFINLKPRCYIQKIDKTHPITTVSEVHDETPASEDDYHCNNQDDESYDPYDLTAPLIIEIDVPKYNQNINIAQQFATNSTTAPINTNNNASSTIVPPLHNSNTNTSNTTNPSLFQSKTENNNESSQMLDPTTPTAWSPTSPSSSQQLLSNLILQNEKLYTKRSTVHNKIKSLQDQGPIITTSQKAQLASLQQNMHHIDALISQSQNYSEQLLSEME